MKAFALLGLGSTLAAASIPPLSVRVPPEQRLMSEWKNNLQLACGTEPKTKSDLRADVKVYSTPQGTKAIITRYVVEPNFPIPRPEYATVDVTAGAGAWQGPGLALTFDRQTSLSPQRFPGHLTLAPAGTARAEAAVVCQSYDRLPAGQGKEYEMRCDQKNAQLGAGYRFFIFSNTKGDQHVAEIENVFGYSLERSVALGRSISGTHRQYRGAGLELDVDLAKPVDRQLYLAKATYNVRQWRSPHPNQYADITEDFLCEAYDYLAPGTRALRGFMTGRGPAVDPKGVANLKVLIEKYQSQGLVKASNPGPGGIEGGISFCLELASGIDDSAMQKIFREVRLVSYDKRTTSLNLDPATSCN